MAEKDENEEVHDEDVPQAGDESSRTEESKPSFIKGGKTAVDHDPEVENFKQFIASYGKIGAIAALVVGGLFMAYGNHKTNQRNLALNAGLKLSEAKGPADLQAVVENFPELAIADVALARLASEKFRERDYETALRQYRDLAVRKPGEPFGPIAKIGQYYCQEALGEIQAALDGFKAFAAANPDHYLQPMAVFGHARCLEQQNEWGQAKAIYEDFIKAYPVSKWVPQAERAIGRVEREMRKAASTKPVKAEVEAGAFEAPATEAPAPAKGATTPPN